MCRAISISYKYATRRVQCLLACNSYEYIQGHLRTTTARIFLDFSRQNDPVVSSAILLLRRGEARRTCGYTKWARKCARAHARSNVKH